MDHPFKSPAVLSLCPGGLLGLERGLEYAGFDHHVVAYVEVEAFIIYNLVAQMEQGLLAPAPVWLDLKTFPAADFRGKISGITGGYPCQPFSYAGKRGGAEDPRHLWPYIKEIVRATCPLWCWFENVAGHLSLGYEQVREDLQELGYVVTEGIFSAAEVGAPHQRKRLFILAVRGVVLDDSNFSEQDQDQRESGENRQTTERKRWAEYCAALSGGASEARYGNVEDSAEQRWRRRSDVGEKRRRAFQTEGPSAMGNSEGDDKQRDGESDKIRGPSSNMADSPGFGVEGDGSPGQQESGVPVEETISRCDGRTDRWPAGPGEQQYDWEGAPA